jgi:16S rRNA (guanine527-N7)-methyltransferase
VIDSKLRAEAEAHIAAWGVRLDDEQWRLLGAYLADLQEAKANVTAADTPEELVRRHFLDGLAAAAALKPLLPGSPEILDAGCGGGFIGICLKIAWPQARVTLADSVYRKCAFLNLTLARMRLPARVLNKRLQALEPSRYDAVLARALAPLAEALALCAPLAREGGLLAVFQSQTPPPAPDGLERLEPWAYRLPGEDKARFLALYRRHLK